MLPLQRVLASARQFQLTAYDAEYLDTARTQELPLATLRRQLEKAARQTGVPRALDFGFLFQVIRVLLQFFRNGWKRRPTLPITLQQRGGNFQSSRPIMHGELMWMAL